jgi:hypothetical protein
VNEAFGISRVESRYLNILIASSALRTAPSPRVSTSVVAHTGGNGSPAGGCSLPFVPHCLGTDLFLRYIRSRSSSRCPSRFCSASTTHFHCSVLVICPQLRAPSSLHLCMLCLLKPNWRASSGHLRHASESSSLEYDQESNMDCNITTLIQASLAVDQHTV